MKRQEVVQHLTNLLEQKMSYRITLAKKGNIEVKSDGKNAVAVFKNGREVMSGDFDVGADAFFMNVPGHKGQKSFEYSDDIADFVAAGKF